MQQNGTELDCLPKRQDEINKTGNYEEEIRSRIAKIDKVLLFPLPHPPLL